MPIYKLVEEMSYEELKGWFAYFELRPVDWRDDDRTMKYLQTQGVKEKPWVIFPTLRSIYNPETKPLEEGQLDTKSFKGSFMFQKMLGAVSGDKINL
jgi:hypothetical protein